MFKHFVATVLVALAVAAVSPASAQTPPTTSAGTLTCNMAPSIGLLIGSRQRMACRFQPNGPFPHRKLMSVSWARWVWISASPPAVSWRGAYWHRRQAQCAGSLPAPMWVRAAPLALVSALAPTSCLAGLTVRSHCNRFQSKARLGLTCRLGFQVSRLPWHNDDMSDKQTSTSTAMPPGPLQRGRLVR